MTNKLFLAAITIISLSSCVSSGGLYKNLTVEESSLEYLYGTEKNTAEKTDTIRIETPVLSDLKFTESGTVKKKKSFVVPLILVNIWKSEHEYSIGNNVIKEYIPAFIKGAVTKEINRSTALYAKPYAQSDLTLEINIDSIGARGPYKCDGHFLFLLLAFAYSANESAGPGFAYSTLSYTLKRKEEVILTGTVSNQVPTGTILNTYKSPYLLREHFTTSLVEGVSTTLKTNIESISGEVSEYYDNNITHNKKELMKG